MNMGVENRCSLWWHDEALLSRVSHQAIVKRSLDISLQEAGDMWEKDSHLSLLESTDLQVFPLLPCGSQYALSSHVCPPLPHGRNSATLGHLELSYLELEKYKLKTPNQRPLKRKVTTISWEPLFRGNHWDSRLC